MALLAAAGCGPRLSDGTQADGSSTSGPSTSTAPESTSTDDGPTPADDSTTAVSTDDPPPDPGASFISEADVDPDTFLCDTFAQDCPAGFKCTYWASDGGTAWNGSRCVPIAEDPVDPGEPCQMSEGPASGLDDCILGAMCWNADPDTLMGTCISLCVGDYDAASCEDPQMVCAITGSGLSVCLPICDPLLQDCPPGQGCYYDYGPFRCQVDLSEDLGQVGTPCDFASACDPGTQCIEGTAVPGCAEELGCCTEFCDLEAPFCSLEGQQCMEWLPPDQVPIGFENVGVCMLPP